MPLIHIITIPMVLGLGFLIGWVVASQQSIAVRKELDALLAEQEATAAKQRLDSIRNT